jgi:ATPase expression protein 3
MSFSRSLAEYFIKCKQNNWLIRSPQHKFVPLPRSKINELNIEPKSIPPTLPYSKQNHSKLLQDNYDLVGKGSRLERKSVQLQIKTLGYPNLDRVQNIDRGPYPEAQGKHLSYLESVRNDSPESLIHEQNNEEIVRMIIETLVEITPVPQSDSTLSTISLNDTETKRTKSFKRHVYSEIPPLPDFEDDPSKFQEYVYILTHSTFHYKNSSKFNGVISKLLKNLFHPLNANTSKLRDLGSYNAVIHFYSLKWNIATCRELLLQMKLEGITPNATTYNTMLNNLIKLQHIQHISNPYIICSKLLTQMKSRGVKADVVTWNSIFKLLRDDQSKAVLLKNRTLLNIPLDSHSITTILGYLAEIKELGSYSLLRLIHSYDFAIDRKLLCVIVKRLVQEGHFDAVFKLLDSVKGDQKVSSEPMNLLLVHFSNIGRVDLVIATINTFKEKYDVKPDANTYNLVMKSIARSGEWKQRYKVWRVMYKQMQEDLDNIITGEYWIRQLRAYYKFNRNLDVKLNVALTDSEVNLKELKNQLKFEGTVPLFIDQNQPEHQAYASIAKKFGSKTFRFKKQNETHIESDANDLKESQRRKRKNYKKKISLLSIQKAMVKRIPYAQDSYTALDSELRERGIIE